MRVLVCGSRDWTDDALVFAILDELAAVVRVTEIIEGDARGVDRIAGAWAEARGVSVRRFPADWERHGMRAGVVRNEEMLIVGEPNLIVAFPTGRSIGTRHMMSLGRRNAIAVWEMPRDRARIAALGEGVFV